MFTQLCLRLARSVRCMSKAKFYVMLYFVIVFTLLIDLRLNHTLYIKVDCIVQGLTNPKEVLDIIIKAWNITIIASDFLFVVRYEVTYKVVRNITLDPFSYIYIKSIFIVVKWRSINIATEDLFNKNSVVIYV